MGLKSSWLKSLGLKCHLSRRLKDISTPDFSTMNFSTPWFKNSWLKSPGLKSSWLKSLGLKGPGLKLGVEKSGVEMSFNQECLVNLILPSGRLTEMTQDPTICRLQMYKILTRFAACDSPLTCYYHKRVFSLHNINKN